MSNLPEKCPICGEPMEKGVVRASGAYGAVVSWLKTSEINKWRGGERLSHGINKADFNGIRCKNCKIILFSYEKEREKD